MDYSDQNVDSKVGLTCRQAEAASCGLSAIAELLDYVVMFVVENERLTR